MDTALSRPVALLSRTSACARRLARHDRPDPEKGGEVKVCCRSPTLMSSARVACHGASAVVTRRSDRLDPIGERLHELLQEFSGAAAADVVTFIKELVDMADIGLGLLHGRHAPKHERLPEMMIGAKGRDRTRRAADDGTRLAVPDACSLRPGAGIQGR